MNTTYIRQFFQECKTKPYLCFVSIFGTAFAITLIMMYVMAHRSFMINIEPEVNRERTLYVKWVGMINKETGHHVGDGYLSLKTIRECFQSLKTAENICIISPIKLELSSIKNGLQKKSFILFTDDVFWKIMDFKFIDGIPYTKAEFDAGIRKTVIGESLCLSLFGTVENIVGSTIEFNHIPYTICGIVKDVTTRATYSFANAWVPFTSVPPAPPTDPENITGNYKCMIVAHSSNDFEKIRKEVQQQINRHNSSLTENEITLYRQPDTKYVEEMRFGSGYPHMREKYIELAVTQMVILLVPALNLSGLTSSRLKDRMGELGIRKAFGGTRWNIIKQILLENMILSLIGGLIGLIISYFGMYIVREWVFTSTTYFSLNIDPDIPTKVLINPGTFIIAFLFCTLLNLLSTAIPAWRITSQPIVESLKNT